jgi:hypothetical protein
MDLIAREDVQQLLSENEGCHVSLYMPTHGATKYNAQDPVQFKNLLNKAEDMLVRSGLRRPEADEFLLPAHGLLADQKFWQSQSDGFAVFIGENQTIRYFRLPVPFEQFVHVGNRYYVKQLLPLFVEDGRYCVLALSQGGVRLLQGTRYNVSEIDLRNVPESLKTAMKFEQYTHLQRHQRTASGSGMATKGQVSFHGEGIGMDDRKDEILRYFQQVDKGLHAYLRSENAPLVLAGVDYLMPIYRAANSYPNLIRETIRGNPEAVSARELHTEAWEIVRPYFQQGQREMLATFMHLYGSDKKNLVSTDIVEILPAVYAGRVSVMFINAALAQWGRYDVSAGKVELHAKEEAGDDDLYDLALAQTIARNGKVYFLDTVKMIPGGSLVAAIYRY